MKYLYNPPYILKKIFSNFIWQKDKVIFSFDDGAIGDNTLRILDRLDEYSISAIFFVVGDNIKKYPDACREVIKRGHVIANHTMYHKKLLLASKSTIEREIRECNEMAKEYLDYNLKYFRPPHGQISPFLAGILRKFDMKCVMWSLMSYDFKGSLDKVKFIIDNYLSHDSLIVLHDSIKSQDIILDSVDYIVKSCHEKGYLIGKAVEYF